MALDLPSFILQAAQRSFQVDDNRNHIQGIVGHDSIQRKILICMSSTQNLEKEDHIQLWFGFLSHSRTSKSIKIS